jgi:hypothetical protein
MQTLLPGTSQARAEILPSSRFPDLYSHRPEGFFLGWIRRETSTFGTFFLITETTYMNPHRPEGFFLGWIRRETLTFGTFSRLPI